MIIKRNNNSYSIKSKKIKIKNRNPSKKKIGGHNHNFTKEELKDLHKQREKRKQEECNKFKIMNCAKRNNACYFDYNNFKCNLDPQLEKELQDCLQNPKITPVCPVGTYLRKYRGKEYCSSVAPTLGNISNIYSSLLSSIPININIDSNLDTIRDKIVFENLFPFLNIRIFRYISFIKEIINEIYYDIHEDGLVKYINKKIDISFRAYTILFLFGFIDIISNYLCEYLYSPPSKKINNLFSKFHKFKNINIKKNLSTNQKELLSKYTKTIFLNISSSKIEEGIRIGISGAQEEYIFRETFTQLLNKYIKIPTENVLKKLLNHDNNKDIQSTIQNIYLIFESLLNGIVFGMTHWINYNPKNLNYKDTLCLVITTSIVGFFLNIIKNYNQDISLVWMIHFLNNFTVIAGDDIDRKLNLFIKKVNQSLKVDLDKILNLDINQLKKIQKILLPSSGGSS